MVDKSGPGSDELSKWLKRHGLSDYLDTFVANRVDLDILPDVDADDLIDLAVPMGDRKRILKAIASLRDDDGGHEPEQPRSSLFSDSGERRQLTILFADLVGSTGLSESLELEEYHALIAAYSDCCARIIRRNNGFLAKYQGDGVLAFFGYPSATEDDAEHAALAGLSITEEIPKIATDQAAPMQARVGIATGIVLVGALLGDKDAVDGAGETLNAASRIQQCAQPGGVLIEARTLYLLGRKFVCKPLRERQLKGFSEPFKLWSVRSLQQSTSRFEEHHFGELTPFVGRGEEMELMRRRWQKLDRVHTILLSGEPGIGKSRLLTKFDEKFRLQSDPLIRCQCLPDQMSSPLYPIIAYLEAQIGLSPSASADANLDRLMTWVRDNIPDSAESEPILAKLFSIPVQGGTANSDMKPAEFKQSVFDLLMKWLFGHAKSRPSLVIFEDLHWADPTTEEFLDAVINRNAQRPLLLVCTFRPEYEPKWMGDAGVTFVNLTRLDRRRSADLVSGLLRGVRLPPEIEAEILAKSDGIPLFIEELTKSVIHSGSLRRDGAAYELNPASGGIGFLPTTLLGSLQARLDRLEGANNVAPLGAAVGRTFSFELLRMISDLDDAELNVILSRLVDAQLLSRRGSDPETTYTFRHALVQDAAYGALPGGKRRAVHGRIAQILSANFPDVLANRPDVVAYHYSLASEHRKAADLWFRAAEQAQQASASLEALAFIENALSANALTEESGRRIDAEIALRQLLAVSLDVTSWGSEKIAANLQRLRELRKARGDRKEMTTVLHGLCAYHIIGGRVAEATELAKQLLAANKEAPVPVPAALGHRCLGFCSFLSGEFQAAISHFEKTIAFAARIDPEEIGKFYPANCETVSRSMICWAQTLSGLQGKADKMMAMVEMRMDDDNVWTRLYVLNILASACQFADRPRKAQELAARGLELSRKEKSSYWEGWGLIVLGWALAAGGSHGQGIGSLNEGLAKYRQTGARQMVPYARTLLADAHLGAGNFDEAAGILESLTTSREPPEIRFVDGLIARISGRLNSGADTSVSTTMLSL